MVDQTMKQSELNSELMRLLQSLNPKSQKDQDLIPVVIVDASSHKPVVRPSQDPYIVLIAPDPTK